MPFRKKKVYARFNVATMMRQLKEVRERTALEQEKVLAATRDLQAKQAKVRRIQQKVINVLRFLIELLIVIRKPMAVHLFTYYAINAVYILNLFKQLTTVGMLLLA